MIAHHEIVQIVRNQLRILLLAIRTSNQVPYLLERLCLQTQFDGIELIEFTFEGKTCRKSVRRLLVCNCPEVLHLVIWWKGEIKSDGIIFGDGLSEENRYIGDSFRVRKVKVVYSVCALKVVDDRLTRDENRERQVHLLQQEIYIIIIRLALKRYYTPDYSRKIKKISSQSPFILNAFGKAWSRSISQLNQIKNLQDKILQMKEANQRRVHRTITAFSIITAIIAVGHAGCISLSIQLSREEDQNDPDFGNRNASFWIRMAFVIGLGFFALIQFAESISILFLNSKNHTTKSIYYSSLIGMMASFCIGVYLTIEAIQLNAITRQFPKDIDMFQHLMPFYWSLQAGATATFLFVFPMMAFTFYHKLEKYLVLQRQERSKNASGSDLQGWFLCLFLINCVAHVAFIVNMYQYSAIMDSKDYGSDNAMDVYAFYFMVAVIVEVVAIILQLKNLINTFLSKRQNVMLAVLVGLFQMGALLSLAITAAEFFIQRHILGEDLCRKQDCKEDDTMKWELFSYAILNLICILVNMPYLKLVSTKWTQNEERDTLITTNQEIQA